MIWAGPPPGWPGGEPWPPELWPYREPDPVAVAGRRLRRRWRWYRWAPRRVLRWRVRRVYQRRRHDG